LIPVKCASCNQKKGRRECPALEALICAQCCGSKRGVEIRCPDDCPYFGQAMGQKWLELFQPAWAGIKGERERKILANSLNTCFPLVIFLQRSLLAVLLLLKDPGNQNALEALKLLEAGYRAGDRGIIYEPSSTNLNIQAIVQDMRKVVKEETGETKIPDVVIAESFRILVLFAENYISDNDAESSYFQLLRRFHPSVESPGKEESRIIITG